MLREIRNHGLAPEHRRFQHIGLVDRADALAARARGDRGDLGDAFDLRGLVDHRVDRLLLAIGQRDRGLRLAEINAARQLADADDVDAVRNALRLERRGVDQVLVEQTGADVGEETEGLAQRQERGALGLFLRRQLFPFRTTDGAE
jgi:hypothetical protein